MAEAARHGTSGGSRRWLAAWLVFAGICVVAVLYLALVFGPRERAEAIEVWRGRLTAMADGRKAAITAWLDDRRGDATSVAEYPTVAALLSGPETVPVPLSPAEQPEHHLQGLLDSARAAHGYSDLYVVDSSGQARARSAGSPPLPASCLGFSERAVRSGLARVDFYVREDSSPMLAVVAPVKVAGRPVGTVLLSMDPGRWLYPLLRSEPVPSSSAESTLAQQVGDRVEYLSPLRLRPGRPMSFRLSASSAPLVALAAIRGEEGFKEYRDYRGAEVLGAARHIPGTGWGLVVKVDRDEALSGFGRDVRQLAAAIAGLLLAVAGLGFGVQRAMAARHRRELGESEARFAMLRDHAQDGIWFVSSDGTIQDANESAAAMHGWTREELIGQNVREFRPPEDLAATPGLMDAVRRGKGADFETFHMRRDGSVFPTEVSSRVLRLKGEEVFLSVYRDITKRKRAEASLAASEMRYRRLFESAKDGILILNAETGTIVEVNPFLIALLGYPSEELVGRKIWELGFLADVVANEARFEELRRNEFVRYDDLPLQAADGRRIQVEFVSNVYLEDHSKVIQCNIRDITERRQAEETLRESEERYRDLVENSSDLICTHDLDGTLLSANAAAVRISGFQIDSFGAFNLRDLVAPGDGASVDAYLEVIRREGSATGVMKVITRSGKVRYWEYRNSLRTEGVPTPVVRGIARDITERKLAEKALRESEERYRTLVAHSPDGIFLVDLKGNFLSVNETICRGLGFSEAEMLAMSLWDIVPEGQWETHKTRLARILKGESLDDTAQYEVRAKTGQLVPVEVRSAPYLEGEEIVGFQAIARDITERTRAEEALRQSEARFKTAFASSPIGMALVAPDGRYLEVNSAFCKIVGYAEKELLARTFQDITHPDDLDLDLAYVRQILAGEILTYQMEKRYLHKQGQAIWTLLSVALIRDRAGQPLYFVSQVEDITERKLAAQALRASEERYRLIAENTADVIWTLDLATRRMTYVSPSVERLRGFTPEEVVAQPLEASLTPDSARRVNKYLAAALAAFAADDSSATIGTVEAEMPTKDGGTVQTEIVATALMDSSGRVTGVLGVTRDVTERMRTEESLRLRDSALAAAANAIVITDTEGRIEWANPAFTRLTGYDLAEVQGQNPRFLNSGVQDRAFYEQLWRTITSGGVWHGEMVNRRRDGTLYPEEMTITPVHETSGAITHFIAVKQDMTEHKHLEEQLRHSQKMEAVGQLAGGVAHDFNNLLQAMLSLTEMLVGHLSDPERLRTDAAELEQQVRRGAALTRQLLLFSRRETVRPERLDLNEVVRDGLTLLRRLLKAHVAIAASLAEGQLPVDADRGQLGQVLINLAVNAGDAMPDGGRLAIETGSEGATVWLKVTDTGGGIPAAIQEHIFEPFFTTKGQGKGTGLGLSVVHGIVTRHGGTVTFESREGQGTTFTVTLPRAGSGQNPAVEVAERGGAAPLGHGELVLVVEDEESARQALAEMLTMLGYTVTAVGSGEEAGRLSPEKPFDVLLTDLMLPGISGGDLASGLLARWPGLRVVLMSGYTEDEAVRVASQKGVVRFLQKPFDMDTLARELHAALETE